MVAAAHNEFRIRYLTVDPLECLNHEFEPFVRPPFAKCEDSMDGITATRKLRLFRAVRKDAMRPKMNVVPSILFLQNLAIAGKQNGNGVGQEHATCSYGAREPIQPLIANTGVFQVYRVHQVMQGDVRVGTGEASEHWRHQPRERNHRTAAESTEEQIEPYNVWLQTAHRTQQMNNTLRAVV